MSRPNSPTFESLEERKMLAATPVRVTSFFADNRGFAEVTFNQALNPASLTKKSVRVMSAGTDGQFGTADDQFIARGVGYKKGRLTINANLAPDTRYRIRLGGVRGVNNLLLDGEFNGMGKWTGNGVAGGNFDVTMQTAANPRARFHTTQGFINVGLYKKPTPLACWPTSRPTPTRSSGTEPSSTAPSAPGSRSSRAAASTSRTARSTSSPPSQASPPRAPRTTSRARSRWPTPASPTAAPTSGSSTSPPNSALDTRYSVFGKVLDGASQKVIENINKLPIVNATGGDPNSPFGELPVRAQRQNIQVPG